MSSPSIGLTSLDIELTRRCNLRCDHCFVGWSRGWSGDIPFEIVDEIMREGAGRFDLLHLTGGEPFAYRALFDVIDRGIQLGYPSVLINTNATLIDDAAVGRLSERRAKLHLTVSLDGPELLHDRVRGEGTFAASNFAVRKLLAAGVATSVMVVVTREVLSVLPAFLRDSVSAHPQLHGITLFPVGVGPAGSQKPDRTLRALRPDDLQELALVVALAFRADIPVGVGAYPIINPLLRALGYPPERLYACTAGRGRICVHADLGVSSCHPVKDPIYGRWRAGLFDAIPSLAIHRRLATRDFEGCRTCGHREECGHCRAFVTASGEPLFGNDQICVETIGTVAPPRLTTRLPVVY